MTDEVADEVINEVADEVTDMVADMKVDKVSDMKVDKVAAWIHSRIVNRETAMLDLHWPADPHLDSIS